MEKLDNCYISNVIIAGQHFEPLWYCRQNIETETIYEDGETVRHEKPIVHQESAHAVAAARAIAGISQKQLDSLKENCESSRNCCGE